MLQTLPSIQHGGIFLSGFFEYDSSKIKTEAFTGAFEYSNYFEKNKSYLVQKYYPNWLQTLYPQSAHLLKDIGLPSLTGTHLYKRDITHLQSLEINVKGKSIPFSVSKMEVHLFRERLGVFTIQIILSESHLTFENIADAVFALRNTTDNPKYPNTNPLVAVIEKQLITYISGDDKAWRHFNPQLKLFLNIDTATAFSSDEQWNEIPTDLATVNSIGTMGSGGLHDYDPAYYSALNSNNVLRIYHNWRAMFLFDSVVRISINLKEADTNNMWDNEYITIYIFTQYIQLYLYRVNEELSGITSGSSRATHLRDKFIKFRHDFDLKQISYKFLPNEIFNKLLTTLEIQSEMNKLDEKINRIDTAIREVQEERIEKLLAFMVFITVFSIILDGTNLIMNELNRKPDDPDFSHFFRIISALLFVGLLVIGVLVYKRWKRKQ